MAVENRAKSKFLSNGLQLICDVELGKVIGKNEAIFLQQVYYWLEHESCGEDLFQDGRKWIYNTYKDWAKQLDWSVSKVRRTIKNLEDLNILVSCKPEKADGYHRKSYTIDFNILRNILGNYHLNLEQIACVQNEQIIIETENTCITSITSGKEIANNSVKQPPKPPRKETM